MKCEENQILYLLSKDASKPRSEYETAFANKLFEKESSLINKRRKEMSNNKVNNRSAKTYFALFGLLGALAILIPGLVINRSVDNSDQKDTNTCIEESVVNDDLRQSIINEAGTNCVTDKEYTSIEHASEDVSFKLYFLAETANRLVIMHPINVSTLPNGSQTVSINFSQDGIEYVFTQSNLRYKSNEGTDSNVQKRTVFVTFDGESVEAENSFYELESKASDSFEWTKDGISYSLTTSNIHQKEVLKSMISALQAVSE